MVMFCLKDCGGWAPYPLGPSLSTPLVWSSEYCRSVCDASFHSYIGACGTAWVSAIDL